MKFVALVSGGKDSFYSIMECIRNNHELLACAHLSPRKQNPDEDEESYMYQTAGSECIQTLVEECVGVPLVIRECVGRSKNTSLVYDHDNGANNDQTEHNKVEDEVEDLYELLAEIKRQFPSVEAISSGAILSTYQRTRIESVCSRLGLISLGYMWRMGPQRNLLECMLKDGLDAVLVKVASPPGLMPQQHLNKTLGALFYGGIFDRLKEKFDFHICGEGGEYETLVVDCPIFRKRLVLEEFEIIEGDDGVGVLKVMKCCAVDKDTSQVWEIAGPKLNERVRGDESDYDDNEFSSSAETTESDMAKDTVDIIRKIVLPTIRILPGGLAHVSEMVSQYIPRKEELQCSENADIEAELAVLEAKSIFAALGKALKSIRWTKHSRTPAASAKDIVFVHLYLGNISHFAKINEYYREFFGTVLPPSRSCVGVGDNVLAGGRRVMMDCMIQRGSGEYMRILPDANPDDLDSYLSESNAQFIMEHKANPHHKLRSTLHVQTISHWAPVCVGPYSQANTLRSSLIFMAGQIGLNGGTMTLVEGGWARQLSQSWKNAASVLDALEGSLDDVLAGVVYIGSDIILNRKDENVHSLFIQNKIWEVSERICRKSISQNGGIIAGLVDGIKKNKELYGGYEDFETYQEVMGSQNIQGQEDENNDKSSKIPLLMVALPAMPVKAESEVELICATQKASSCLGMETCSSWADQSDGSEDLMDNETEGTLNWDTGYDGIDYNTGRKPEGSIESTDNVAIQTVIRSIGKGCASVAFTAASFRNVSLCDSPFPLDIFSTLLKMVESTVSSISHSGNIGKADILHIRLFHSCSEGDDGANIRSALHAAVGLEWRKNSQSGKNYTIPAISIVPVKAMFLSPSLPTVASNSSPFLAMQTIAMNLVHTETEMWIHNRSN